MNVWTLIGRSYATPFERFAAMVKIFWPAALAWACLTLWSEYSHRLATTPAMLAQIGQDGEAGTSTGAGGLWPNYYVVVGLLIAIGTLTTVSALVRWHRHLINQAEPSMAGIWLRGHEWWFLWRWTWLGATTCLFFLLVLAVLVVGLITQTPIEVLENPDPSTSMPVLQLVMGLAWILVVGTGLTGWLFPRTFLSLAAIAVGEGREYQQGSKTTISASDCSKLTLAILATTAPLLLVSLYLIGLTSHWDVESMAPLSFAYIIGTVLVEISNMLAFIVFATMLSLFYRFRFR